VLLKLLFQGLNITWFSQHRNAASQRGGGEGSRLQSQGDQDLCAAATAEHLIFKTSTEERTVDLTTKDTTKDSLLWISLDRSPDFISIRVYLHIQGYTSHTDRHTHVLNLCLSLIFVCM
jgi:hypothetical protein